MVVGPPWFDPAGAFSLDGRTIRLREPTVRDLVTALLVSDDEFPDAAGVYVVSACCADHADREWLFAATIGTIEDAVPLRTLEFVADELVAMYCGMPRWSVQRLWQRTFGAWLNVDGELQLSGVDVFALPPARATAAVLGVWRRWLRENEREMDRLTRELETPPLRVINHMDDDEVADDGWGQAEGMLASARRQDEARNTNPQLSSDTLDHT